jgi:Carboxylesterase family
MTTVLIMTELSRKLTTMWSNFVKAGNPTSQGIGPKGGVEGSAEDIVWRPATSLAIEVCCNIVILQKSSLSHSRNY